MKSKVKRKCCLELWTSQPPFCTFLRLLSFASQTCLRSPILADESRCNRCIHPLPKEGMHYRYYCKSDISPSGGLRYSSSRQPVVLANFLMTEAREDPREALQAAIAKLLTTAEVQPGGIAKESAQCNQLPASEGRRGPQQHPWFLNCCVD